MNTGLVGPALREIHRQIGVRSFGPYWHRAPALAREQTREQRAAWSRAKRLALEAKLDPKNREVWRKQGERLAGWVREQPAAGTWRRPEPRDLRASVEKAVARWRELLADPSYRAEHERK